MFIFLRAIACVRQLDASRRHWRYAKFQLAGRVKGQADRAGDAFGDGDLRESAGFRVDAEDDNGIGVLVFSEKEAAGGIDGEVAGFFAASGDIGGEAQPAILLLDVEHSDGVVAAVRGVKEFGARMHSDFGSIVATREARWQRRNALKRSGYVVIGADKMDSRNGGLELAQNVHVASFGGEHDMARPRAWSQLCRQIEEFVRKAASHGPRGEGAILRVERVPNHAIEAKVSNVDGTTINGSLDPVCVRCFLAFFVGTEGAGFFYNGGVFTEFAVGEDWENDYVAGSVVGDEKIFAGFVEGEIARIFANSRKFVQEREFGGFNVDGEGADGALLTGFVCGVGPFTVGMNHDPGRIGCFDGKAFGSEFAGGGVKFVCVDALAARTVCVSAYKREVGMICGSLVCTDREREKCKRRSKKEQGKNSVRNFHGF